MGGLAFYGALTLSINRALDNEALASASDVAAMVNENRLPNPVPVSGAQVIQVVDAEQRVVGGSITADRLTPLLRPDELASGAGRRGVGRRRRTPGHRTSRCGSWPCWPGARRTPVSVIAAVPIGDVLATRTALRNALLITIPVLLAAARGDRLAGDRLDAAAGRGSCGPEPSRSALRGAGQRGAAGGRPAAGARRPPTRSGPWPSP